MHIFSAEQTRQWDAFTIEQEPISSFDLMNRAAAAFVGWFREMYPDTGLAISIFCGTGNNGGDGVAVGRMLQQHGYAAKVVVCDFSGKRSADFEAQLRISPAPVAYDPADTPDIVIDALFGTGLSRPLSGEWAALIDAINALHAVRIAIDLPSGLLADAHTPGSAVVRADQTLSFERPKLAFFLPENAEWVGDWHCVPIGLHPDFERSTSTQIHYITGAEAAKMVIPRKKFAHKGSYGHALLIAGAYGKMGAAILAARACLRAGAGLLSVHAPACGNLPLQSSVPEAMFLSDKRARHWSALPDLTPFSSIGIGPGIGQHPDSAGALEQCLKQLRVLQLNGGAIHTVLDADALNILSGRPELWAHVPENSIITPHPKEFERLFGKAEHDFARLDLMREKARQHQIYIILKGAHTAVACPDGALWFNTSGNPGMATGGSGDVLTGILTGLPAQGYGEKAACLLGVYLHGLAGDKAAETMGQAAVTAGSIAEQLGKAWLAMENLL